jgi:acyl-CoA thioesterase FadM
MNLYFRLVLVLAAAFGPRSPLRALDTSRLSFRTGPGDLDLNGHMNNGRFLTLMDLGRVDLTVRTGVHRVMLALRCKPVVASEVIRFRRPLLLGQRFSLDSRIIGWDQRSVYIEHRVHRAEEMVAVAMVRGMFAGPGGTVAPERLARAIGYEGPPPPLPPTITSWRAAEEELLGARPRG